MIADILTELSNHNERNEERKNAMLSLIKLTREGTFGLWDEHFKTILLILLETLGDNNGHIRALALRVLREILRNQPQRFRDFAELTTLRILEAHKDSVREVVRSAEECADKLANYIPPEQSVRILNPIIQTAQYPINLAAIIMQNKMIEFLPKETVETMMPDIIPGLLRGYDDQQSTVRKASVFCLVAMYLKCGEVIWNHLTKLNYSKLKLLNRYIKRAQQKEPSKGTPSPHTSDS